MSSLTAKSAPAIAEVTAEAILSLVAKSAEAAANAGYPVRYPISLTSCEALAGISDLSAKSVSAMAEATA